ncbi:hypothetical protein Hte_008197 [Hypoxylon texense]
MDSFEQESFEWEWHIPASDEACFSPFPQSGEESVEWEPPQYVSLSDLQVIPRDEGPPCPLPIIPRDEGPPCPPPTSEYFPYRVHPFHLADASQSQGAAASASAFFAPILHVEKDSSKESKADVTKGKNVTKGKKKEEKDTLTLNEFWNEAGKDWEKLELTTQERRRAKAVGMAACHTGLDCHTCGARLNVAESQDEDAIIEELIQGGACKVCGCFN